MLKQIDKKYLACILFSLSIALFIRTKNYEAVWDDARGHFTPVNQSQMDHHIGAFWTDHSGMYIPVTFSTWAIVKRMASAQQFNPAPFHVLNVLTHSINGVILFYLLLLLFKNNTTAFFGSILFLIHPLQVEAVAWISEFRGLYSTLFCLLSLLFFFNQLKKYEPKNFRSLVFSNGFLLAFLFFILALLSKPSGIVLPLIILVLTWRFYNEKMILIGKSLLIWFIPACIVIVLLLTKNTESSVPLLQRFLIAGFTLCFYLQKIVFPFPLVACYGYTPQIVAANPLSYAALIVSITLAVILFLKRHAFPDAFAAFLIILICILPVLGFIPFEYQKHATVADRYMYMSFIGVALLIAPLEKYIRDSTFLKVLAGTSLLVLTILTIKQMTTWKNEFTVWDHTLSYYDNSSKVYYNRGVEYSIKGDFGKALADYSRALELDPTNVDALFNRANTYENLKDMPAAFKDYDAALKIKKDGEVYYKRSNLYLKTGDIDNALDDLQRAEELKYPFNPKYKELLLHIKFQK